MHLRIIRIHGMEKYVIESRNQKCVAPSGLSHLVQGWLVPKGHAKTFPIYGALHLGMHLFSPIRWNEAGDASGRGEGSENETSCGKLCQFSDPSSSQVDQLQQPELGITRFVITCFTPTRPAGNILGMRVFPPKYHRYAWIFLSSHQTMIV